MMTEKSFGTWWDEKFTSTTLKTKLTAARRHRPLFRRVDGTLVPRLEGSLDPVGKTTADLTPTEPMSR